LNVRNEFITSLLKGIGLGRRITSKWIKDVGSVMWPGFVCLQSRSSCGLF
jgi:hypothetical protein